MSIIRQGSFNLLQFLVTWPGFKPRALQTRIGTHARGGGQGALSPISHSLYIASIFSINYFSHTPSSLSSHPLVSQLTFELSANHIQIFSIKCWGPILTLRVSNVRDLYTLGNLMNSKPTGPVCNPSFCVSSPRFFCMVSYAIPTAICRIIKH